MERRMRMFAVANEATRADTALYPENNPIYDNGVAQLRTLSGIVIPNVDSTAASSLTGANGQLIYSFPAFEELRVWSGGAWKSLKPTTSGNTERGG